MNSSESQGETSGPEVMGHFVEDTGTIEEKDGKSLSESTGCHAGESVSNYVSEPVVMFLTLASDSEASSSLELIHATEDSPTLPRKSFVAFVNSFGGPFYSSRYVKEHEGGLCIVFKSISDIFDQQQKSTITFDMTDRCMHFKRVHNLLMVLLSDTIPRSQFCLSHEKRTLRYCYNMLIMLMFSNVIHECPFEGSYNSMNIMQGSEHFFDRLFYNLNNDLGSLFEAFRVIPLPIQLRSSICITFRKYLTKDIFVAILYFNGRIVYCTRRKGVKFSFMDMYLIANIVSQVSLHAKNYSLHVPVRISKRRDDSLYNLYINRPDEEIDVKIVLLRPMTKFSSPSIMRQLDLAIYEDLVESGVWAQLAEHLLREPESKSREPRHELLRHFVYRRVDAAFSQLVMCSSTAYYDEFSLFRLYSELCLKSKGILTFSQTSKSENLVKMGSHGGVAALFLIFDPLASQKDIANICKEILEFVKNFGTELFLKEVHLVH